MQIKEMKNINVLHEIIKELEKGIKKNKEIGIKIINLLNTNHFINDIDLLIKKIKKH